MPDLADSRTRIRNFAIEAHGDQKYGEQPYVAHLDAVWAVLCEYGFDDSFYFYGAYLHDVREDCGHKSDILFRLEDLGAITNYVVNFCTDETGHNRKTRKAATYERCRAQIEQDYLRTPFPMPALPIAVRVKLADRLANLRNAIATGSNLIGMYRKERDAFKAAYYVAGLCEPMWLEYDRLLGSGVPTAG